MSFIEFLMKMALLLLVCPDIQTLCELIAQDKYLEVLYESDIGPVYPIDVYMVIEVK